MKLKTFFLFTALLLTGFIFAQDSYTLTGTVVSAGDGASLPGASVTVLGTKRSVITDIDGAFSIKVNSDSSIQVSFIGKQNRVVLRNGPKENYVELTDEKTEID